MRHPHKSTVELSMPPFSLCLLRAYSSAILNVVLFAVLLVGSGCATTVRNMYYDPPQGRMELSKVPEKPLAVVREFIDLRRGHDKPFQNAIPILFIPFLPYKTYEYPTFYKTNSMQPLPPFGKEVVEVERLSLQYTEMTARHITEKQFLKCMTETNISSPAQVPLFEITGEIKKTMNYGHMSFLGLGAVPGVIPFFYLASYCDGYYIVDVSLECRDILGNVITDYRIKGETEKWKGNLYCSPAGAWYQRLDLLATFLSPEIEKFARTIHEELEKKNTSYWNKLYDERSIRRAKATRANQMSTIAATAGIFRDEYRVQLDPKDLERITGYGSTAAILTFDARGGLSSDEVALLSDRFSIELDNCDVYRLISRSKMTEILELQKFSLQDSCTANECAVEAGQILGVRYMIYGSIGKIGSLYTLNSYLVSVEKGVTEASATTDVSGGIEDLLTKGMPHNVQKLLRATMK